MKCRYCGHEIPEGKLRCSYCRKEVRIVPDYNPLEDVLAAQVKGAIDGTEAPLDDYEYRTATRSLDRRVTERNNRQNTHPGGKRPVNAAQSKKQAERKKALKKKRRNRMLILLAIAAVIFAGAGLLIFQNSYAGQVKKGNKALEEKQYSTAIAYFEKAIDKNAKKPDAYTGLSQVYMAQNVKEKALKVFDEAIENNPDSVEIHRAAIMFYLEVKENNRIPLILDNAGEKVCNALEAYIVKKPKFSLDANVVYEDVQQLSLDSDYEIRYTLDGSDPDLNSTKYTEPIQIPEDETIVKAIAVNEEGVPSMIVTKTYVVELPMEDAPAVSPSTGQYDEYMEISIVVPDGYTAYYTMDRSEPDENSTIYTGPIDMPEGSTIFKAVLVNSKGKLSGVTTRNYELNLSE